MDRRRFLQKAGLLSAALTTAKSSPALEAPVQSRKALRDGKVTLGNEYLSWRLEWQDRRLAGSAFENRLSGRAFPLSSVNEFVLTFSASKHRVEIPWWRFVFGPDEGPVPPEQEQGLHLGYHRREFSDRDWGATENLLLRSLQGLKSVRGGITYDGYGWFRRWFELPQNARGEELCCVLGGYDHLDWSEYWVYVNGLEIGHRESSGRWRTPRQFDIAPRSPAYSSLGFGPGEKNLLAVRTRGYDKHFGGLSDEVLKHYVFEPTLVDQFLSVGNPYLRVSDLEVQEFGQAGEGQVAFDLRSASQPIRVSAHYQLDGPTRRKRLSITNIGREEMLLLDVQLDDFTTDRSSTEGGWGEPIFLDEQAFAAIEHPAGLNQGDRGRIRLMHFPGRRLPPGKSLETHTANVSVTKPGEALSRFISYIQERSPRRKKALALYTPYGVNNQWGGCPPLADVEVLDTLGVLEKWQEKGVKFDYFTLDQGWVDPTSDLTRFAPQCFPNGPGRIAERVRALGMEFGLWFAVSWGGWSCGEYPPVWASLIPAPGKPDEPAAPALAYRNGYLADGGVPGQLCVASEPYFSILKDAVLYHIKQNRLRFFKLDTGNYYCNSILHNHLPGKYSVEAMYERLLDIAATARAADPDVYVMWYWGIRSPFFALHGDSIFESGLFMEGSGTSWYPTLYYRDSVTLNLDQSTQFAKTIPPVNKDSLGIWLADTRWGNFMGNQRWREALVMDLGRGNLLFPQLWGDANLLNGRDVDFLAELISLVKKHEALFLRPRRTLGEPWKNEVYGYTYFDGARGLVFLNNVHFASRAVDLNLGAELGVQAAPGTAMQIVSRFPEQERIVREDGREIRVGASVRLWVRPFEVLLLEIAPSSTPGAFPPREIFAQQAEELGRSLPLASMTPAEWMGLRFADAARFEQQGLKKRLSAWSTMLPPLEGEQAILAIAIRLREGNAEWRYSPTVVEIVQVLARIGPQKIPLIPVPDARQFGNTQKAGCSWVVYKVRLNRQWSGKPLQFAVHAYLPEGIEARVDAWVVKQWWEESPRPLGDGYFGDEPS